jgi:formamidopyrimidine-DNA glycosylase
MGRPLGELRAAQSLLEGNMPELPEVETTVRGLARVSKASGSRGWPTGRTCAAPSRPICVQALTGATSYRAWSRAKYGLIHTDRGDTMVFHLGMSGRWRIDPEARSTSTTTW